MGKTYYYLENLQLAKIYHDKMVNGNIESVLLFYFKQNIFFKIFTNLKKTSRMRY